MNVNDTIKRQLDRFNAIVYPLQGSFNWTDKNTAAITRFVEQLGQHGILKPSIGGSWLHAYLSFQYEYWMSLDTNLKKGVHLTWIIGAKAIQRYVDRPFKDLTKCTRTMMSLGIHPPTREYSKSDSKELQDAVRRDTCQSPTVDSLVQCLEFTTMYDPSNKYCRACQISEECRVQLIQRHPTLFVKRGLKPIK